MLAEQYREVKTVNAYQITALLKVIEKDRVEAEKNNDLVAKARAMLKQWGAYSAYSSKCGYKNVSSMFSALYPKGSKIYIENEIEFIEQSLLKLKNSKDKKHQEQYKIAEYYYKGFDVVDSGCDWSERVNDSYLANIMGISERTLYRRLNSIQSFIVSQVSFFDYF